MKFSWDRFNTMPLIAILRGYSTSTAERIAQACFEGGLNTLEITLNSPSAFETVAALSAGYGNEYNIGVGTVCTSDQVYESKAAGASFVVTPAVALDVIAACREVGLPIFCGALTPSEALTAHKAGADAIKLFPASQFGPHYLAAIRAPLNDIRFVPTGGITAANIPDYLAVGAQGFGLGSSLFPREAIDAGEFEAVTQAARQFVEAYTQAKKN